MCLFGCVCGVCENLFGVGNDLVVDVCEWVVGVIE